MAKKSDHQKLLDAGYKFIRTRDQYGMGGKVNRLDIVQKVDGSDWRILERDFPSKAARERRMNELLQDKKTLNM